jgi:serine/threonine protein phosphatase PrpC
LKKKEFCIPVKIEDKYLDKVITNFTGPYIDSSTDIETFILTKEDEYLIIGSDGLWDLINSNEISSIILENSNKEDITRKIFDLAIDNACKHSGIKKDKLFNMTPGYIKRKIIDDLTLLVVDLKNQVI